MIHPTNRLERLRVKKLHEEKKKVSPSHARSKLKESIKDLETKDEIKLLREDITSLSQ